MRQSHEVLQLVFSPPPPPPAWLARHGATGSPPKPAHLRNGDQRSTREIHVAGEPGARDRGGARPQWPCRGQPDRKSTRLNSSHLGISYAVFCLKRITEGPSETHWATVEFGGAWITCRQVLMFSVMSAAWTGLVAAGVPFLEV